MQPNDIKIIVDGVVSIGVSFAVSWGFIKALQEVFKSKAADRLATKESFDRDQAHQKLIKENAEMESLFSEVLKNFSALKDSVNSDFAEHSKEVKEDIKRFDDKLTDCYKVMLQHTRGINDLLKG